MPELSLFEPGEYLPARGPGQFTLAGLPDGRDGKWCQKNYPVEHLHTVVEGANPRIDTYISQATFTASRRRIQTLEQIAVAFVDLDTYKVPELASLRPDAQCARVLAFCEGEGIPVPSLVMFSGRGLYAKWLLAEPTQSVGLFDWQRVETRLVELLAPLGADPAAKDAARVLRLEHTVNTKTGEQARVLHVTGGVEACPARYAIDQLWKRIRPAVVEPRTADPDSPPRPGKIINLAARQGFTWKSLAWGRHEDLRKLWQLRGGCPVGQREITLFWRINFLMQADLCAVDRFYAEAQEIARDIWGGDTSWFRDADLSTVYQKAKAARAGKTVVIGGREITPLYTPSHARLISDYHITADEMRELAVLIDRAEKERRRVGKRREAGVLPRDEYAALSRSRPWEAIGISRQWYYELRKRGRIETGPGAGPKIRATLVNSPPARQPFGAYRRTSMIDLREAERRAAAMQETGDADTWKPTPGESIAGQVVEIDHEAGLERNGSAITLLRANGARTAVWLGVVLKQQLEQQHVQVGEVVGIKYHGERTSGTGRMYKHYGLEVYRDEPSGTESVPQGQNPSQRTFEDDPL